MSQLIFEVVIDGEISRKEVQLTCCSSAAVASAQFMLTLRTGSCAFTARVYDEHGECVCQSNLVPLYEPEEWVCVKSLCEAGEAQAARLLSHACDSDGWTLTVDVKERPGKPLLLHTLRVLRHSARNELPWTPAATEQSPECDGSQPDDEIDDAEQTFEHMSGRSFKLLRTVGKGQCEVASSIGGLLGPGGRLPAQLLQLERWREMVRGSGLTLQPDRSLAACLPDGAGDVREDSIDAVGGLAETLVGVGSDLVRQGYSQLPAIDWGAAGVSLSALAGATAQLERAGFPPVFLFMFDQPWLLCERLFDSARHLLGDTAELDEAVFAWALKSGAVGGGNGGTGDDGAGRSGGRGPAKAASHVGSNFGRPHRDSPYAACHTLAGQPSELSVWVPLVDVTTSNGCMLVVPANRDPLFAAHADAMHMRPGERLPWAYVRALPCEAGSVLLWRASLIHWGSACTEGIASPRKSIAMAFKLPAAGATCDAPLPSRITRSSLANGLSLDARLRIVLRALLKYEHWHPGFAGLDPESISE